jgi:hypothetical protein
VTCPPRWNQCLGWMLPSDQPCSRAEVVTSIATHGAFVPPTPPFVKHFEYSLRNCHTATLIRLAAVVGSRGIVTYTLAAFSTIAADDRTGRAVKA